MVISKKWTSRKFIAWVVSTVIFILLMVFGHDSLNNFIPWWGSITLVWLGVEGGADIVGIKKDKN